MIDITKIAKAAAKKMANFDVKLVPGALAYTWKDKNIAFVGLPVKEMFPTRFEQIRAFLRKGSEEASDASWEQVIGASSVEGVAKKQAASPFAFRPYARSIQKVYGDRPAVETFHGKKMVSSHLYSEAGRPRIRPSRREALEIAVGAAPFMEGSPKLEFLDEGAESDVFKIGKEHVLKLSQPLQTKEITEEGRELTGLGTEELIGYEGILQPKFYKKFGKYEASVYPLAIPLNPDVAYDSAEEATNILAMAKLRQTVASQGLLWTDPAVRNAGMYQGKPMIIDTGFIYKSNRMEGHLAPNRAAGIEGLSEKGTSAAIRKILTNFGSGWQGLEEGFSTTAQTSGNITMLKLMKGEEEAGFLTYSMQKGGIAKIESTEIFKGFRGAGHGRSLYKEAGFYAKEHGALYFRSDIEGKVSESATKAWESGIEEMPGIIEKIAGEKGTFMMKLGKLTENVMKSGNGAALSQAGVAEVPSAVRVASRIIKSL